MEADGTRNGHLGIPSRKKAKKAVLLYPITGRFVGGGVASTGLYGYFSARAPQVTKFYLIKRAEVECLTRL